MALQQSSTITVPGKLLETRQYDVVVAGAGTAGAIAAIASARQGAATAIIEPRGYPGGTATDGATVLSSFYNAWKSAPGATKRQVVKGIPQEVVTRLQTMGGTSGHVELAQGPDHDSLCTNLDTELLKLVLFEMLDEAKVFIATNSIVSGVVKTGQKIDALIVESTSGREAFYAGCFVDCTGFGQVAFLAGASCTEANDYPVGANIGVGNVSLENYHQFLQSAGALTRYAEGERSGKNRLIIRLDGDMEKLPAALREEAKKIGLRIGTATPHDNYFMSLELNLDMTQNPADIFAYSKAEVELRKRQFKAVQLIKQHIPGCTQAFIARTSHNMSPRRIRTVKCDDEVNSHIIQNALHQPDKVMVYGFAGYHPAVSIKNGDTFGIPYGALRVSGIDNLLAAGMMLTSEKAAHEATRTTVCCMGMGQAAGTAAGLCATRHITTRELDYDELKSALVAGGVYFEEGTGVGEPINPASGFSLIQLSVQVRRRRRLILEYSGPLSHLKEIIFDISLRDLRGRSVMSRNNVCLNGNVLELILPSRARGNLVLLIQAGGAALYKKLTLP